METVTLVLNAQQVSAIMDALANSPFKVAAPVIQAIDTQIRHQTAPKRPTVVPPVEEPVKDIK